jgi:hypothetical protein
MPLGTQTAIAQQIVEQSARLRVKAPWSTDYLILRKSKPDAFAKGTAGYVVHPVRLAV